MPWDGNEGKHNQPFPDRYSLNGDAVFYNLQLFFTDDSLNNLLVYI